jgi:DNA-binding NtrC family response regulator
MEQAIAAFAKHPRALVLLDMQLRGSSGLDVLREIKERNPRALVVQMSGYSEMHSDMERGIAMSAYASITKPLNIDELVETLRRVMREPIKRA